jgi:hypothetical protein
MAFSIRSVGCGTPGQPPPEHMQVLEGLLRKFVVDTDTYFIQDFQVCSNFYKQSFAVVRVRVQGSFCRCRWTGVCRAWHCTFDVPKPPSRPRRSSNKAGKHGDGHIGEGNNMCRVKATHSLLKLPFHVLLMGTYCTTLCSRLYSGDFHAITETTTKTTIRGFWLHHKSLHL